MIDIDKLAIGVTDNLLASPAAQTGNLRHVVRDAFLRGYRLGETVRTILPENAGSFYACREVQRHPRELGS